MLAATAAMKLPTLPAEPGKSTLGSHAGAMVSCGRHGRMGGQLTQRLAAAAVAARTTPANSVRPSPPVVPSKEGHRRWVRIDIEDAR